MCVAPTQSNAGGAARVPVRVSLDGGNAWSAEAQDMFEYVAAGFYGLGLDSSEMGGGAALATEYLPGGTGKVCATALKPSNGRSTGGTMITVTAQGGLPKVRPCKLKPVETRVCEHGIRHRWRL